MNGQTKMRGNLIIIILGTCPEIIKMSPIIQECKQQIINYFILHTGQHYSDKIDRTSFKELGLSEATYNLDAGFDTHAEQTRKILADVEKALMRDNPDVVFVQDDTNTVPAGVLAAAKLHIRVGHVEAGLWSPDGRIPEEINRVMTDHIPALEIEQIIPI